MIEEYMRIMLYLHGVFSPHITKWNAWIASPLIRISYCSIHWPPDPGPMKAKCLWWGQLLSFNVLVQRWHCHHAKSGPSIPGSGDPCSYTSFVLPDSSYAADPFHFLGSHGSRSISPTPDGSINSSSSRPLRDVIPRSPIVIGLIDQSRVSPQLFALMRNSAWSNESSNLLQSWADTVIFAAAPLISICTQDSSICRSVQQHQLSSLYSTQSFSDLQWIY